MAHRWIKSLNEVVFVHIGFTQLRKVFYGVVDDEFADAIGRGVKNLVYLLLHIGGLDVGGNRLYPP